MFSHIVGNETLKTYLTRMIKKKMVGNALLFAGPDGVGKSLFADALAQELICGESALESQRLRVQKGTHPDLHIYQPEGKLGMHSIASMRSLTEQVYLPPLEAQRKIFIIHHADRMLPYSSNALLKTFEEPTLDTAIILLSSSPELLLPTILSRCSKFHFKALAEQDIVNLLTTKRNISLEDAKRVAAICQGSVSRALSLLSGEQQPLRQELLDILAVGKFRNYSELIAKTKHLAETIEANVKSVEELAKEELLKGYCDKLTAAQREGFEKELDGLSSMQLMREASSLFEVVLSWYRDLHLLKHQGDTRLLFNPDRISELQKAVEQPPNLIPLEDLLDIIKTEKLSLARSTGLSLCLENMFLRLQG